MTCWPAPRFALRLFAAVLPAIVAIVPEAVHAQVRGRITDASTGEPVAGALVRLSGPSVQLTSSASNGDYAFLRPVQGSYCIRADSPGYDPASVCIVLSGTSTMTVDLPLQPRPVLMTPITVTPVRASINPRAIPLDSMNSPRVALLEARSRGLAGAQLSELTQSTLDNHVGGRNPHTLYVWGSSAERGRVLLDGATVNAPLHLGALMPPLDVDVIEAADVRTGGTSPRYDGGTTYIMDFATRAAARERRFWGEVDPLAARIGAESPINGHGRAIVSARRVNDEVIEGLVSPQFGYGYTDGLARIDLDVGGHSVYLTGLATHETVRIPRDAGEDRASWDNRVATLGWRRDHGSDRRSAMLTMSRGVADLPLLSAVGGHLAAYLDRYSALAQRRWRVGDARWDAGVELEHLRFRRRSRADRDPVDQQLGPVECIPSLPCSHSNATLISAFAQWSLQPASGLSTTLGARTMFDARTQRVHILPRASLVVMPAPGYALTLAAGRFSQTFVREAAIAPGDAQSELPIVVDVAHATHIELGLARRSESLFLKAGAYVRFHERNQPARVARTVPGGDVLLEYTTGAGTLAAAYSISGNPLRAPDAPAGTQHLATAAYRHNVGRWQVDLTASYGSGLPLTSIVLEQPTETELAWQPAGDVSRFDRSDRNYVRVDASLSGEWLLTPGGRDIRIVPYVRIINALSQRESLFYYRNNDPAQPPRPLATLPAVPVLGVRWNF